MSYYVYTLNHPINNLPFYVGYTNNPDKRMKQHLADDFNADCLVSRYIQVLVRNKIIPTMNIIQRSEDKGDMLQLEADLIDEYSREFVILNARFPNSDPIAIPDYKNLTKKEKIDLCGVVMGWDCNYYTECPLCFDREKEKRIGYIQSVLDQHDVLYYAEVVPQRFPTIRRYMNRHNNNFIRIPGDDIFYLITEFPLRKKYADSIKMSKARAIDFLTKDESLFISNGRRSASANWSITIG